MDFGSRKEIYGGEKLVVERREMKVINATIQFLFMDMDFRLLTGIVFVRFEYMFELKKRREEENGNESPRR